MSVAETGNMLEASLQDPAKFDRQMLLELDAALSVDPSLRPQAMRLAKLFTQLAEHPDLFSQVPSDLIPHILSGASLTEIFEVIPPHKFEVGLQHPTTAPPLVDLLCRVDRSTFAAAEKLCKIAIGQLVDPEIAYAGRIERLAKALASIGELEPLIPATQLYESPNSQLQTRLMALNLILLDSGIRPRLLFWDLSCPDIRNDPLALDSHIIYLADLCDRKVDIKDQIPFLAQLYRDNEPFVCRDIENVFLVLFRTNPLAFQHFDLTEHICEQQTVSMLSRIRPSYLVQHHPDIIKNLTLSARTASVYCNLVSDLDSYKLLPLSCGSIENLPFDLRVQLIAAATRDKNTSRLFIGTYPYLIDQILAPSSLPSVSHWQGDIRRNLLRHGVHVRPTPEVATESRQ